MAHGTDIRSGRVSELAVLAFLAVLTLGVFAPVVSHDFVNYDDPVYVTKNPAVAGGLSAKAVGWALTAVYDGNWFPVTWLSHMADASLYGLSPGGHHLTSLLIHLANTLLLFVVFKSATGRLWPSALTAALFAVHPLHVEAVAWVAERKELLGAFFGLLAAGAYIRYTRRPAAARYLAVAIFFALSLAAKPMWMTLPLLLLLLDRWPLGRLSGIGRPYAGPGTVSSRAAALVWEKLPLFFLSAASGTLALYTQAHGGAVRSLAAFSLGDRIANALVSYAIYLIQTLWPRGLAVYYPLPAGDLPLWQPVAAGLALCAVTIWVVRRRSDRPYLAVGWIWFLVSLLPVIGLVQIGTQARADRYTYMPLIGIFFAAAWWICDLAKEGKIRPAAVVVVSMLPAFILAASARAQLGNWKNSITLFEHALEVTGPNPVTLVNLGEAYEDAGKRRAAVDCYRKALALAPEDATAMFNLANVLEKTGDTTGAVAFYRKTLAIRPRHAGAAANLAGLMAAAGDMDAAIDLYQRVLKEKPDSADAYGNLANALAAAARPAEAVVFFKRAIRLAPADPVLRCNYAIVLDRQGRVKEAIAQLSAAVRARPKAVQPYCLMARFFRRQGKDRQADRLLDHARKIDPQGCPVDPDQEKRRSRSGAVKSATRQGDRTEPAMVR